MNNKEKMCIFEVIIVQYISDNGVSDMRINTDIY
jgi:hypothetical protein